VTALALDPRGAHRHAADEPAPSLLDDLGGQPPTLDELISGAWQTLGAHQHAACPVCGGDMTPEYGVHPRPIAGRCGSCDTQLG
jgi:hypothetical protein